MRIIYFPAFNERLFALKAPDEETRVFEGRHRRLGAVGPHSKGASPSQRKNEQRSPAVPTSPIFLFFSCERRDPACCFLFTCCDIRVTYIGHARTHISPHLPSSSLSITRSSLLRLLSAAPQVGKRETARGSKGLISNMGRDMGNALDYASFLPRPAWLGMLLSSSPFSPPCPAAVAAAHIPLRQTWMLELILKPLIGHSGPCMHQLGDPANTMR